MFLACINVIKLRIDFFEEDREEFDYAVENFITSLPSNYSSHQSPGT